MSRASIIGAILGFIATRSFFGAFIGYLIGSALGSSFISVSSSNQSGRLIFRQILQNEFATALLILSASVMKADGSVKKSELEFVKQFFNRQFPPSYAREYILRFRIF